MRTFMNVLGLLNPTKTQSLSSNLAPLCNDACINHRHVINFPIFAFFDQEIIMELLALKHYPHLTCPSSRHIDISHHLAQVQCD